MANLTPAQQDLFDHIADTLADQRSDYDFFILRVEGGRLLLVLPAQSGRRVADRPIDPKDIDALATAGYIERARVRQQVNITLTEAGHKAHEAQHRRLALTLYVKNDTIS